ncbi:prepilin peptidase [Actinacidiphila guanduensis]|uniref:Leader peptidase (Prepilin peptidase) / N-methyltransferase n=1 Tax=Actinacidiphila guanduensis TaxID=310781 RepID=A0A1H0ABY3_9ACTN|nr:A24 family peptidase [Actinacidiphila guanduensis]SDN31138.1 leader peptidase (prepilin peptidase) / N-methyltransferase [Actinacidiphila guanduensis]
MHVYLIVGAAVWGMASGLLLPRAAYRLAVPAEQPWARACPAAHPVAGWLGPARCRACGPQEERYGAGYGIALACAVVCGLLAWRAGAHPELAVWLLLTPAGILLARVDLAVHRLPDVLTLPALALTAVLLGGAALLTRHQGDWPRALIAAAALFVLYGVLFFVNPAGMGFGDVKLAPTLGLALGWYGWPAVVGGTFAGFLLGAVVGLALIATRRATRKTALPFGPFMLTGALLALLLAA